MILYRPISLQELVLIYHRDMKTQAWSVILSLLNGISVPDHMEKRPLGRFSFSSLYSWAGL
jgi:hypothetical protein